MVFVSCAVLSAWICYNVSDFEAKKGHNYMDKHTEQHQLFKGAFLLTYAGLISKVLSAGYRIPLQNITGDVGFYVYQQIYPFIGMVMILALYGFPAAISRLIAGQSCYPNKRLKRQIFIQLLLFSITLFMLIYWLAPFIADLMGDKGLTEGVRASAFPFLLLPFVSCLRGLFQGQSNMTPTAFSQMVEQVIRVSLIICAAFFVTTFNRSFYDIGIGTAWASVGGGIGALIILLIYQYRQPSKQVNDNEWVQTAHPLFIAVIGYGIAIAINHMLLLLLQFVDAFTLIPLLRRTGMSLTEAQILKGVLDRGQPLAQLGIVVASSLALALIPSVTKARLSDDKDRFLGYIASTWRFTLYLASGATIGLIILFPEVNTLLFKENLGSTSLQIFTITIIFSALSISTASILQGLGHIFRTAVFVLIGVIVKWGLNLLLVPQFQITGAALATVLASLLILILNLIQLKKILPVSERIYIPWKGFTLSLTLMAGVVFVIHVLAEPLFYQFSRMGQLLYLVVFIAIGVSIYFVSLVKLSVFTKEERQVFPFLKH